VKVKDAHRKMALGKPLDDAVLLHHPESKQTED